MLKLSVCKVPCKLDFNFVVDYVFILKSGLPRPSGLHRQKPHAKTPWSVKRLVLFTFKCCWSSCIPTGQKTTSPSRFDLLCILWKMLRDLTDIKLQYMLVSQLGSAVCLRSRPKSTRDRIEVKQKAGLLFWLLENVGTKWQWWKLNYNLNWES